MYFFLNPFSILGEPNSKVLLPRGLSALKEGDISREMHAPEDQGRVAVGGAGGRWNKILFFQIFLKI